MSFESILCIALIALGVYCSIWPPINARRMTKAVRKNVEMQFAAFTCDIGDPVYHFSGADAEIVEESEEGYTINGAYRLLRIQRYARNRHGEYFLFISDGTGKPFFNHVQHNIAQIALGDAYIPPPGC